MKTIKVEEILNNLFKTIPTYEVEGSQSDKLFFSYGEQKSLNQILTSKYRNCEKAYPLLWYKMPNTLSVSNSGTTGVFDFVLAHNTNHEYFNDQRFKLVFDRCLYPNLQLIIQAFKKSGNIQLFNLNDNNVYEYTNYPNYGSPTTFEGKDKTKQVDYWDATGFRVKLKITNNCMGEISYDTKNIF